MYVRGYVIHPNGMDAIIIHTRQRLLKCVDEGKQNERKSIQTNLLLGR